MSDSENQEPCKCGHKRPYHVQGMRRCEHPRCHCPSFETAEIVNTLYDYNPVDLTVPLLCMDERRGKTEFAALHLPRRGITEKEYRAILRWFEMLREAGWVVPDGEDGVENLETIDVPDPLDATWPGALHTIFPKGESKQ